MKSIKIQNVHEVIVSARVQRTERQDGQLPSITVASRHKRIYIANSTADEALDTALWSVAKVGAEIDEGWQVLDTARLISVTPISTVPLKEQIYFPQEHVD